ncbi:MAG: hypothetical protein N3B13_09420, partial [Deltaproteobacteria bacterium]|nr:hypothetical protein [Deltaproteobacteria bacterium]
MKKIFLLVTLILAGTFVYISCSDETGSSEDTSVAKDSEIKDITETRDEVTLTDTEKDTSETPDAEPKDEQ